MRNTLLLTAAIAILCAMPAAGATETAAPEAAPATCGAVASTEAPVVAPAVEPEGLEGIALVGTPDPIATACANEWYEYRWVYGGCCGGNQKKTKQQRRQCCFDQSGTHCSGWVDTGAFTCSGACPI